MEVLSNDVLQYLLDYLSLKDLSHCSATCHRLHDLLTQREYWRLVMVFPPSQSYHDFLLTDHYLLRQREREKVEVLDHYGNKCYELAASSFSMIPGKGDTDAQVGDEILISRDGVTYTFNLQSKERTVCKIGGCIGPHGPMGCIRISNPPYFDGVINGIAVHAYPQLILGEYDDKIGVLIKQEKWVPLPFVTHKSLALCGRMVLESFQTNLQDWEDREYSDEEIDALISITPLFSLITYYGNMRQEWKNVCNWSARMNEKNSVLLIQGEGATKLYIVSC